MDDHEPRSLGNQNIITYCSILYMAACANTHIQTCMHTYRHTYIHIHTHTPLHCITLHCITLHYTTLHYIHTHIQTYRQTYTQLQTYVHPPSTHAYIHACKRTSVHPPIQPSNHSWSVHTMRPPSSVGKGGKDLKSSVAASWWDKSDPSSESMVFIQGGLCKKRCQVRLCKFPLWRSL